MKPEEETIWRFLREPAMDAPDFGTGLLFSYLQDAKNRRALTDREDWYFLILRQESLIRRELVQARLEMVRQAELEAASQG